MSGIFLDEAVRRASQLCEKILALADGYKYKGKVALQARIAKGLAAEGTNISRNTVARYLQTIRAVLGQGKPVKGHVCLYKILSGDEKFKELACGAIAKYDSVVLTSTAYQICEKILALADEYKTKGKVALMVRIAKDLTAEGTNITQGTVADYLRTIHAVLGRGTPAKGYERLYKILSGDEKFKELASNAIEKYDSVVLTSTAYSVCQKIIALADEYKDSSKDVLQARIARDLPAEGTNITQGTVTHYIQTIRAVLGQRTPPSDRERLCKILSGDEEFKKLARGAIAKYDLVRSCRRGSGLDAAITDLAISNAAWVIDNTLRGVDAVRVHLGQRLLNLAKNDRALAHELAGEVIVRVFVGYLYHSYAYGTDPKAVNNPRAFLTKKKVPRYLHLLILEIFEDAKRHGQV